jgi:hypothetical protein
MHPLTVKLSYRYLLWYRCRWNSRTPDEAPEQTRNQNRKTVLSVETLRSIIIPIPYHASLVILTGKTPALS